MAAYFDTNSAPSRRQRRWPTLTLSAAPSRAAVALCARPADGSEFGATMRPQPLETHAKVFSALHHLASGR
jgi:hypothetical protein